MKNISEDKVKETKREYYKKYREANKDKINKRTREWRKNNKDKVKAYREKYWNKKAMELMK